MTNETAARLRMQFLERHRDADWLVFDSRTHQAVGAIYYSPDWFDTPEIHERDLRNFFRAVQAHDLEWLEGKQGLGEAQARQEEDRDAK